MQIKCPRCQARATLPDSKEGAKVRCGQCGRVFVAGGGAVRSSGSNPGLMIALAVGGAGLLGMLYLYAQAEDPLPVAAKEAAAEAEPEPEPVDTTGWDAAPVRTAVLIHDFAHRGDLESLKRMIDPARMWAAEEEGRTPAAYRDLPVLERLETTEAYARTLLEGAGSEEVVAWKPHDGQVLELFEDSATVRLDVAPRDPDAGTAKRHVQWEMVRGGSGWKAWKWERWISPEEARRLARAERARQVERVTLSDGSVVLERDPEPLPHLETTPPDLAAKIDELFETATNLDLTTEANRARAQLVDIGKPAIPRLLTGLYEIPLDTQENAIRANIVDLALRDITGQDFGYKPQLLVGSSAGTTAERRESAIRQWFAWWYRNEATFEKVELEDGLEDLIELSEEEKDWLERNDR